MATRDGTDRRSFPRSHGERLDAERRRRPAQCRILGRKRQAQAHGEFEVGRIVGREAPLARERQYITERTPRQVGSTRMSSSSRIPRNSTLRAWEIRRRFSAPSRMFPISSAHSAGTWPGVARSRSRSAHAAGVLSSSKHQATATEASRTKPVTACPRREAFSTTAVQASGPWRTPWRVRSDRRRRSDAGPAGTSRATATPRRVITISAPRATSSSSALRCVLASNVPISFMTTPLTSQMTSLSRIPRDSDPHDRCAASGRGGDPMQVWGPFTRPVASPSGTSG